MALISDILQFIVRYRIHIGVLAALTTLIPFETSADGITLHALLAALAMGMLVTSIGLGNKLADAAADMREPRSLPIAPENQRPVFILAQILLGLPILWLLFMPPVLVVYIIFGAALGYLFNYGILLAGRRRRLKNVFLVKNLVPALSYALCVAAPYAFLAHDALPVIFIIHAVSAFTLILLHEILCDMRDLETDRAEGIRTLPDLLGLKVTKAIGVVLMAAYVLFMYALVIPSINLPPTFALMAVWFLAANDRRPWWYYQGYLFLWLAIVLIDLFI